MKRMPFFRWFKEDAYPKLTHYLRLTASKTIQASDVPTGTLITNLLATGAITITLPLGTKPGYYLDFTVGAAQVLNIATPTGAKFNGLGATTGTNAAADDEGESIRATYIGIDATDSNKKVWQLSFPTGTWTLT